MGLPIIEWIESQRPDKWHNGRLMTARDISVEELSYVPQDPVPEDVGVWETQSNVTGARFITLPEAGQPLTTRPFSRYLRFGNATPGATPAIMAFRDVNFNYDPPGLVSAGPVFTNEDWVFRCWVRAESSTISTVQLILNTTGAVTTTTLSSVTTTWQLAHAIVRCTSAANQIVVRLQFVHSVGRNLLAAGLFCGRCVNFAKQARTEPGQQRAVSRSTSLAGVTQTDHFRSDETMSLYSHDEDAVVRKNFIDFTTHAQLGGYFGIATDRTARDNPATWMPKLVLTQDSDVWQMPIGAERYRMTIERAAQQRTLVAEVYQ